MFGDSDIKIVGDKPSLDVKKNQKAENTSTVVSKEMANKARNIGKQVAKVYIDDVTNETTVGDNAEMLIQRQLLLSFTATIGFEQFIGDDALIGIAQKSFLDTIKAYDTNLYKSSSDTGAFSFYYLAFRREIDIERRIGQTFAMLCSHDGDPIFQELGEALYCWFTSKIKKIVSQALDE